MSPVGPVSPVGSVSSVGAEGADAGDDLPPAVAADAAVLGPGRPTDLAGRVLGGCVVGCNDEFYAGASSLILPGPAVHDPAAFDAKGKVYDGWETRRRRTPGADWAIVQLAGAGLVERVEIDTSWFRGNYPPAASVEGVWLPGYPSLEQLATLEPDAWVPLTGRVELSGDAVTTAVVLPAARSRRVSHVRLRIFPDGGVARLRVHGRCVPDPELITGTIDLLAGELGGSVLGASDEFYATAAHLLLPGRAALMSQGWENARRRDGGHDWVLFALAVPGVARRVEVDTSWFVGNAPGRVRLLGADVRAGGGWRTVLDVRPQPDRRHLFALAPGGGATTGALTHLMLQVHPDGGLARLRLWGEADAAGLAAAAARWAATA